ncbi:MAG: cytochrome c [Coriobacteriia bacterium]|nr:cytochrome c [Coriobacteriia bacterium]
MGSRTTLVWGIALVIVGSIGLGAVLVLGSSGAPLTGAGTFTSPGQRIYYTGLDDEGRPIPRTVRGGGMMGGSACVDCHGEDCRGGSLGMMFGAIEVPDIRYSALTSPHSEGGTAKPAWSDRDITRAIREGFEPDGQRIKAPMPRWDMTDTEANDVIAYLKELDTR